MLSRRIVLVGVAAGAAAAFVQPALARNESGGMARLAELKRELKRVETEHRAAVDAIFEHAGKFDWPTRPPFEAWDKHYAWADSVRKLDDERGFQPLHSRRDALFDQMQKLWGEIERLEPVDEWG